ncbi:MAG: hypothetical protein KFF72_07210 [Arthrospira sp. SH-MAG29]|nr:hypothetical protein [Arthrospira sp. SH-MAG29]MBS0016143.1 hypothetical protein [Arthrospira sp. SH-MAG29]
MRKFCYTDHVSTSDKYLSPRGDDRHFFTATEAIAGNRGCPVGLRSSISPPIKLICQIICQNPRSPVKLKNTVVHG